MLEGRGLLKRKKQLSDDYYSHQHRSRSSSSAGGGDGGDATTSGACTPTNHKSNNNNNNGPFAMAKRMWRLTRPNVVARTAVMDDAHEPQDAASILPRRITSVLSTPTASASSRSHSWLTSGRATSPSPPPPILITGGESASCSSNINNNNAGLSPLSCSSSPSVIGHITLTMGGFVPNGTNFEIGGALYVLNCCGFQRAAPVNMSGGDVVVAIPFTHIDAEVRITLLRRETALLENEYVGQTILPLAFCLGGLGSTRPYSARATFFSVDRHLARYTAAIPEVPQTGIERPQNMPLFNVKMVAVFEHEQRHQTASYLQYYLRPLRDAQSGGVEDEVNEFHPNVMRQTLLRFLSAISKDLNLSLSKLSLLTLCGIVYLSSVWLIPFLFTLVIVCNIVRTPGIPRRELCRDVVVWNSDPRLEPTQSLVSMALEFYDDLTTLQSWLETAAGFLERIHNTLNHTDSNVSALVLASAVMVSVAVSAVVFVLYEVIIGVFVPVRVLAVYGTLYVFSPFVERDVREGLLERSWVPRSIVREEAELERELQSKENNNNNNNNTSSTSQFWGRVENLYSHIPKKPDVAHHHICSLHSTTETGRVAELWYRGERSSSPVSSASAPTNKSTQRSSRSVRNRQTVAAVLMKR
eukprot:PhM_4_TR14415/c0_g1_i1/m.72312